MYFDFKVYNLFMQGSKAFNALLKTKDVLGITDNFNSTIINFSCSDLGQGCGTDQ